MLPARAWAKTCLSLFLSSDAIIGGHAASAETVNQSVAPAVRPQPTLEQRIPISKQPIRNLDDLGRAMTHGMVLRKNQKQIFNIYLPLFFGDPNPNLGSANFEAMHAILSANPNLEKPHFREHLIESVRTIFRAPEPLIDYISGAIRSAGQLRGSLFQIDSNLGFWHQLLKKTWGAENSNEEFTPDFSRRLIYRLIPQDVRDEIASRKKDYRTKTIRLFKVLDNLRLALLRNGRPHQPIAQVMVDLVHAVGFANPHTNELLRSKDGLERIRGLTLVFDERDAVAMELGFAGHFDELMQSLGIVRPQIHTLNLSRPHPKNPKQRLTKSFRSVALLLEEFDKETRAGKPIRLASETTRVRSLSLTESGFRTCLGGSDCSSRTYFEKAFDPNFYYFTKTDKDFHSSGHITIVLGTATDESGNSVKVAYVDKIQSVSNSELPTFLEAVRLAVAEAGYVLALSKNVGDHNGLSNMETTRAFVHSHLLPKCKQKLSTFTPHSNAYTFKNGHSTAYGHPDVLMVEPLTLENDVQIVKGKEYQPWMAPEELSIQSLISETIAMRDSPKDEDKLRFIYSEEAISRLVGMLGLPSNFHALALEKYISEPESHSFAVRKAAFFAKYVPRSAPAFNAADLFLKRLVESFTGDERGIIFGEIAQWEKSSDEKKKNFFKLLSKVETDQVIAAWINGKPSELYFSPVIDWFEVLFYAVKSRNLPCFEFALTNSRSLNNEQRVKLLIESFPQSFNDNVPETEPSVTILNKLLTELSSAVPSGIARVVLSKALMNAIQRKLPFTIEVLLEQPSLDLSVRSPEDGSSALSLAFYSLSGRRLEKFRAPADKLSALDRLYVVDRALKGAARGEQEEVESNIAKFFSNNELLTMARAMLTLSSDEAKDLPIVYDFLRRRGLYLKVLVTLPPDDVYGLYAANPKLSREFVIRREISAHWTFQERAFFWMRLANDRDYPYSRGEDFGFLNNFTRAELPALVRFVENASADMQSTARSMLLLYLSSLPFDDVEAHLGDMPIEYRISSVASQRIPYDKVRTFLSLDDIRRRPFDERLYLFLAHWDYGRVLSEEELKEICEYFIRFIDTSERAEVAPENEIVADPSPTGDGYRFSLPKYSLDELDLFAGWDVRRTFRLLWGLMMLGEEELNVFLRKISSRYKNILLSGLTHLQYEREMDLIRFHLIKNAVEDNVPIIQDYLIRQTHRGAPESLKDHLLHIAANAVDTKSVKFLLESGANPNTFDSEGRPVVYLAVVRSLYLPDEEAEGKREIEKIESTVATIVQSGGTIKIDNLYKGNILHRAANYGYGEMIRIIMENGGDPYEKNGQGLTAIQVAQRANQEEMVNLMLNTRRIYYPIGLPGMRRVGFRKRSGG